MAKKSDQEKEEKKSKKSPKAVKPKVSRKKAVSSKKSKNQAVKKAAVKIAGKPKKAKKIIFKTPGEEAIKAEARKRESIKAKSPSPPAEKAAPVSPPATPGKVIKPPVEPAIPVKKEPDIEGKVLSREIAQDESAPYSAEEPPARSIKIAIPITVKDLAIKLELKPNELMMGMIEKGIFATINQPLDGKIVSDIARIYGVEVGIISTFEEETYKQYEEEDESDFVLRAPVVTLMGHVDHGKTSLLDMIRKTKIAAKEYGSITQHIGAYEVELEKGAVTFLDTPGHEAFTAMRARGANATDVVVLVVAADDGVMPQTVEAIDHARAAGVPIVVALNKCDLPHIDLEGVKNQLSKHNLLPEDWGGSTVVVEVSAKTGKGIDQLLELLLLEAEMLELKANPKTMAKGVVVESELSHGRGVVATILVQSGTLHVGEIVIAGSYYGKIKAMINDKGEQVHEAPPSMPVAILGLSGVPQAGEKFFVVKDERKAREFCMRRQNTNKERELSASKHVSLAGLYKQIEKNKLQELKVIVKGDVSGSIEALQKSLLELSTRDIKINVIHSGVGNVNDADVVLAHASNAIIIGFHVKVESKALGIADRDGVEIKLYNIIYEATADIRAAMEGMLEPISKEVLLGRAQVRQVFSKTKVGTIAGCYIVKGKIGRNAIAKLFREGKVIYEGKISSLKRFKDDAKEVAEGFECGIALSNFNTIKTGDIIEVYEIQQIARRLEKR
ncbi:MAG: translation initiation factor IF-2 [Candidatus Omnitrophica bacterium]|nr:translation initiation factor IF-2 [Candidatus Omnitrophota bacterium]